ncbi:BRO1-domain-containing protein [Macrolepiota fuliginosa MF-IS2]|uniref:BRO1-domain-containing protein n=1 Tax=Macrolepiota fuliginosa MF-IS2 TaxID=1400762 RepID=A0A9P5XHE7_9AGAR|nr:BRO1-domain-containing protein [Macrolepiota fuliginosa MF-IS2]
MPNLLDFPFKRTYEINLQEVVRNFISFHGGGHPDEFKSDIQQWQDLRKNGAGGVVHVDRIHATLLYHAQLTSILAKMPSDIQLEISYAPVFQPRKIPITLKSLVFERAAILFNLASLFSQLGASADRSNVEGIKQAVSYYQHAAGTLSYLNTAVLPNLTYPPDIEETPLDLSAAFIQSLECLMLAQAQECSWQLAKLNQYKNSLIAKIAARVSSLYTLSTQLLRDADPPVKHLLPSDWISHIEAKGHHFIAVSEYRRSLEELENSRYGCEIARLGKAQDKAKTAHDIGRRGKIAASVQGDIQSLLDTVKTSLARAERDNDLIYHCDVPAIVTLPPIQETSLATATIPPGLLNPKIVLGSMQPLFEGLAGWGAREAINIYNDRKQTLVQERIIDIGQELQYQADKGLRSMNLPAALEALERPIGLPPSLLRKAEEVRLEEGPARIAASIEDVQRLAQHDLAILDEAMDILDSEASEDEAARKEIPLNRSPSHEANVELTKKERRYRSILAEAVASDEAIRQKWDEWEDSISQLTWDEADLEASVPSSTVMAPLDTAPQSIQTRNQARSLRVQLEELDTIHHDRNQLVHQARALEAVDDIQPRILKVASGFERLTELKAEMFEDILDQELAKYDRFLSEMGNLRQKQEALLADVKILNEQFLQSRREDPSVKDREHALQSLDLAYFKYREITRNLEEGFKFYNDLAGILTQFKEVCKTWGYQRRQEIQYLHRPLEMLSLGNDNRDQQETSPQTDQRTHPSAQAQGPSSRFANILSQGPPSLSEQEWGFEDVTLPPGPGR